ncbi:malonate decarboxylase acyl carrier protein [Phyllobacterium chamaecytisi]|uniref:malonate decarboxylase acyl carrier protein n=1 Tax=Phyllobacterium chamaecytisi TaxID=2876082 RepID=UPI001CCF4881|nr:malonate decarboxylase acyl carrier protein [Phyllobacterium sp. KW56]MBZ9601391.1 malonate decarboxylase acyl carrier protein [Phyllobacterium sp. KW56]
MQDLTFTHEVAERATGNTKLAITGVVASGNLEVLVERALPEKQCVVKIRTTVRGFDPVWKAVVDGFVERFPTGGLRFSINDGGARPDTVSLRLSQALRLMEKTEQ